MNARQVSITATEFRKIARYRMHRHGSPHSDAAELFSDWLAQHPRLRKQMNKTGIDYCYPEFLAIAEMVLSEPASRDALHAGHIAP